MFSNNGYSLADIAAATGGGNRNNGGNGGFGEDWAWILVLFILVLAGGWNNNNGNNGGGNGGGSGMTTTTYVTSDVQRGFDQSALMNSLNGINATVNNGFANAEVSRCNSQANILQTLNNIAMNQQNCCCENRAGLADLKYTISTENCADRAAISDGIRDILTATQAQTQTIIDKLCQQEIDALKAQNQQLQMQSYLASLAASQTEQTAQLRAGQIAAVDSLYTRLSNCPVPCMPVYGMQPIFTCNNGNNGCGCSGNVFYN